MAEADRDQARATGGAGWTAMWSLTWARILLFIREPAALFWTFGFPVLLAVGLGLAFRDQPPEPPRLGLIEGTADTIELQRLLDGNEVVEIEVVSLDALEDRLAKGTIDVVATMPAAGALRYRFDPSRPEGRWAKLVVDDSLQRALGRVDAATISEDTEVVAGHRYIDFLIPGLIGLNLMGSALWGVGYSVVQERSRKLLRRFAVTPMPHSAFLMSYLLSRLIFLAVEVGFLIGFAALVFDVPVAGSIVTLSLVALVGGLSFTGIAALVGSRTDNIEVATGLLNFFMLPMWLLSGSFFPYERFPEVFHGAIQALPLTALNDALRGVMVDGAGLFDVIGELGVLAAWGVGCFMISTRVFRWR